MAHGGETAEQATEPRGPGASLTLNDVAEQLGVHYMTVYRYVRTGRLNATKARGEWQVSPADVAAFSARGSGRVAAATHTGRTGRRRGLEARFVASDEPGAWAIVEAALASGSSAPDVHHQLLIPALQSIGRRWANNELTINQEHQATAVAARVVARLGPMMRARGRSRGTVILGAPSQDHHSLTTAILADLLRSARFSAVDLGAHTPPESFVQAMSTADRLLAVGLSASTAKNEPNIRDSIAAIKGAEPSIPVVLGGTAVRDRDHAKELGADEFADRSIGVLERFEVIAAKSA